MIVRFGDKETEKVFREENSKRFSSIARVATRKLIQMNRARGLEDLKIPPGNRLEPLKGNRQGYYSIRINDQWRIVFRWTEQGPDEVSIVDYH